MDITIDQLLMFTTSVEQGSFSAAARKLGKVQSRISSGISDLEISLNFELFDRSGRYPELTQEGKKMYVEAKAILTQYERMRARALTVSCGEESELTIAMDEALPVAPFQSVFKEIAQVYPLLVLRIMTGAKDEVASWVEQEIADIGLVVDLNQIPDSMEQMNISQYRPVLIIAPDHPLAQEEQLTPDVLNQHRQLITTDQQNLPPYKPVFANHWIVNHYHCIGILVSLGLGWAIVPEYIADQNFELKNLIKLPANSVPNCRPIDMGAIKRIDHANGPVMSWLYEQLRSLS